jgi:excisionase family DNA binding protein
MIMADRYGSGESPGEQEFFTVFEVAERLRCKPRTVLNRIYAGVLQAVRVDGTRPWLIPAGEYYRYKSELLERARG